MVEFLKISPKLGLDRDLDDPHIANVSQTVQAFEVARRSDSRGGQLRLTGTLS